MILLSEVVYAERTMRRYMNTVKSENVISFLFMEFSKRKRLLVALNVFILKKKSAFEEYTEKLSFRSKIVLIMLYIRDNLLWITLCLVLGLGMSLLLNYFDIISDLEIFGITLFGPLLFITIVYIKNILNVLSIMDDRVLELEVNLTTGNESMDVMIASDLAYKLIVDYSDELVYRLAEEENYPNDLMEEVYAEIGFFVQNSNLKTLFDSGGRHFQIGGLISLMNEAYKNLSTKIKMNPSIGLKDEAIKALKSQNEPRKEIHKQLLKVINQWIDDSVYLLDEVHTLEVSDIFLLLLKCKDKLMKMNEKYLVYDKL